MTWRTRSITNLSPLYGLDGKTRLHDVTVQTRRFTRRLELETDEQWQAAGLTAKARPWLLARPWEAWAVRYPRWDRQVATLIRFSTSGENWHKRVVVSTRPRRETMGPYDRVMYVSDGAVHTYRGAETRWAWRFLIDRLAADEWEEKLSLQTGMSREDIDALKGL